MTTARIVRFTKGRLFLYLSAILVITGLIACYNNTLSQLQELRKSNGICETQGESLTMQLQVISEYKQQLDKSLKSEKAEHQQTKNELEVKLKELKTKHEKINDEANSRFNALQEHYTLLQTQHDDFKEECSNQHSQQMKENDGLQDKLKEVQEQLKKVQQSKESLKSQYLQVQVDRENLEKNLKAITRGNGDSDSKINHLMKENNELRREVEEIKGKCNSSRVFYPVNEVSSPNGQNVIKVPSKSTTSSTGVKVSEGTLNGARPLILPTASSSKTPDFMPDQHNINLPLPQGVVPVPDFIHNHNNNNKNQDFARNDGEINNRYFDKIQGLNQADEVEKEENANAAQEMHDDAFGFGENEGQNFKHNVIENNNKLGDDDKDNIQNDEQLEENDPDDDPEYGRLGHARDPAVRN